MEKKESNGVARISKNYALDALNENSGINLNWKIQVFTSRPKVRPISISRMFSGFMCFIFQEWWVFNAMESSKFPKTLAYLQEWNISECCKGETPFAF